MAQSNTNKISGPGPMASTGSGPKGSQPGDGGAKVDGAHKGQDNMKSPAGKKGSLKKDDSKGKMSY